MNEKANEFLEFSVEKVPFYTVQMFVVWNPVELQTHHCHGLNELKILKYPPPHRPNLGESTSPPQASSHAPTWMTTTDDTTNSWSTNDWAAHPETIMDEDTRFQTLSSAVRTILECIGENPDREGLQKTPDRYAKALLGFTQGYKEDPREIFSGAFYHEDNDGMVFLGGINFSSLCEHHLIPFHGKVRMIFDTHRHSWFIFYLSILRKFKESKEVCT